MKPSIRQLNCNDIARWDAFVEKHPAASPYHRFAWLEATERAYRHRCFYIAAVNNEQIIGVLPIVLIKKPLGSASGYSLPFCDMGAVLSESTEVTQLLKEAALQIAKEHGAKLLQLRGSRTHTLESPDATQPAPKVRMLLDLPANHEDLFASYKSKLRSQVRKAEKNGLTFNHSCDLASIDSFYDIYSRNMHRLGSPAHPKEWFYALSQSYGENLIVGTVMLENKAVGAGIILLNCKQVCIPWASTLSEYNRLAPNMLLYWSLLQLSCEQGFKQFDFGRSTFGEGTFKFKAQWGAKPVALDWEDLDTATGEIVPGSASSGLTSQLRPHIENLWSKIPFPLISFIGPKLRKYIAL